MNHISFAAAEQASFNADQMTRSSNNKTHVNNSLSANEKVKRLAT